MVGIEEQYQEKLQSLEAELQSYKEHVRMTVKM